MTDGETSVNLDRAMALSALKLAAHVDRAPHVSASSVGDRLPLSVLRHRLDRASNGLRWMVDADGVFGRVLLTQAGSKVSFAVALDDAVAFATRAMLLPHDWRDRNGAVRAWVAVGDGHGPERLLWQGTLKASDSGSPRGHTVECAVPASTAVLSLGTESLRSGDRYPLRRSIWVEPTLFDHRASAIARRPELTRQTGAREHIQPSRISVLVPVHDPPLRMLEEAVASVTSQSYADWELCLVDDGSRNQTIVRRLQAYAATDRRVHLIRHPSPRGIAAATNAALELATGDYIALLDHDDTLAPDALQSVADRIAEQPDLDMIYSDEDTLLDGHQVWIHHKPGWSPDTLRTNGYTCHLGVYRRTLVTDIGGFRTEYDGSQDVDMILRLVERTDRVAHIPRILYHWRAHPASTAAADQSKPYAYVAARNAIAAHVERTGLDAEVGYGPPGLYRVAHRVSPGTRVDIIIAPTDVAGLGDAANSWLAQPHRGWNLVIAAPAPIAEIATSALSRAGIPDDRVTVVVHDQSRTALNAAADAARAEHLVIMQTPAIGLTHDWLTRLIGYSNQPQIGAAGPVVLAPDGRIQQAGIALPEGIPLHLLHGLRSSIDKFFGYGTSVYNVAAVSGVLATRRDIYQRLGGLDPEFNELALIHYCLRATDTGHRIVIVPDARLRTTGPDQTTNDLPTIWRLRNAWAQTHTHDPYYNPNYRTDRGDFEPLRA